MKRFAARHFDRCPIRRAASLPFWRKRKSITRRNMTTRRCLTFNGSPGLVWPCIRAICQVILPATAAFVCRMTSRNYSLLRRRRAARSWSAMVKHQCRTWRQIPACCSRRKIFHRRCGPHWHAAVTTGTHGTITAGTTVILTDHAVVRDAGRNKTIFQN